MSNKKEHLYQFTTLTSEELNRKLFETTRLLNESNAELQKSKKQQQEMFLNISHDLRTPLTVMKNTVESLMLHQPEMTKDLKESLDFINNQIDQLSTMVDRILLLTSLDSKKKQLHLEMVNTSHFLEDFFFQMEADPAFAKRKLVLDIPENFAYSIEIDTHLMFQALEELFINALKFSTTNDTITLKAYLEDNKQLCIAITDSGCGISEESLPEIFERTYMQNTARTPDKNTGHGLGLSLVRSILYRHHASITCESTLGEGSSFLLHVPIVTPEKQE